MSKKDDLSKYYDYDCENNDEIEEKDVGTLYARITFGALAVSLISGSIGVGIENGVLLGISILSFVVMFIFALMGNGKDGCL